MSRIDFKFTPNTLDRFDLNPDRRSFVEEVAMIWQLGIETGLLHDKKEDGRKYWTIDLNASPLYLVDPTPERLYKLIKIARQFAIVMPGQSAKGQLRVILNLTANRTRADRGESLCWLRYSGSITVKQFLQENKFDLSDEALLKN